MRKEVRRSSTGLNHVTKDLGSFGLFLLPSLAFASPPLRCKTFAVVIGITSAFLAAEGKAQSRILLLARFLYLLIRKRRLSHGLLIVKHWPECSQMHAHTVPSWEQRSLLSHCSLLYSRGRQGRMGLEWLSSELDYGVCITGHREKEHLKLCHLCKCFFRLCCTRTVMSNAKSVPMNIIYWQDKVLK